MQDLQKWLQGTRPYAEGVLLYQGHGADKLLLNLFAEGWSAFKEARLAEALTALSSDGDTSAKPVEPQVPEALFTAERIDQLEGEKEDIKSTLEVLESEQYDLEARVDDIEESHGALAEKVAKLSTQQRYQPKGWPLVMDTTVQGLYNQWHPLFLHKKNLQSRITDVALAGETDPEQERKAGEMAHKILDLRDHCRKIYERRNHYMANGALPADDQALDVPTDPHKWPTAKANYQRYLREYRAKLAKQPNNDNFKKQLARYEVALAKVVKLLEG